MAGTHVDSSVEAAATRRSADAAAMAGNRPDSSATHRGDVEAPPARSRHALQVAAFIALIGIALSIALTWAAARIDHRTEQSLLDGQTRQASAVLSTAITVIQEPLDGALAVDRAVRPAERTRAFEDYMSRHVGSALLLQNASLWVRHGGTLQRVAAVGPAPAMPPDSADTLAHLQSAFGSKTTTVRFVTVGDRVHVVYVRADSGNGTLVYAERLIPEDRRAPVDKDSAFRQLHYALYLGHSTKTDSLATTDMNPASLPLDGLTSRETVPFGDNVLTLVTTPREHLGSDLSRQLPWVALIGGLVLTAIAARAGQRLGEGRENAEEDAATIAALFDRAESLFGQQRELFVSLQRALLPHVNPTMPNLEIASRYVAGARGLDIGGDWYSIIAVDDERYGFVVGDVSGRGVDAVAVMAQARFTVRAYLLEGDDPSTALEKSAPQFDIVADGHMTTVLVGVGNARTGEIQLASAGHLPPLLLTDDGPTFLEIRSGRPLGTGLDRYPTTTYQMPPGSTLFCYTDGLVERRGESIDDGLARLARVIEEAADGSVEQLASHAVDMLRNENAADDIALLAMRWTGAR
jgi:serine phosphatase RsbU (regulator of sigma subunit)